MTIPVSSTLQHIVGTLEIGEELFWEPLRTTRPGPWAGHLTTAFWLVKAGTPRVFVELGTHSGNSYSAFCQAVAQFGLPARAYAVDTWRGDEHSEPYGEEVFNELNVFNQSHFAGFSQLLRTTFDEARLYFADRSVDLLHVDGYHSYEAVRRDFETWKSALSERGVVVFHDTNVRERGFGVWRLWEELRGCYPSFEFHHSEGLGVLGVGEKQAPLISRLFELGKNLESASLVRRLFSARGEVFKNRVRGVDMEAQIAALSGELQRSAALEQEVIQRDALLEERDHTIREQSKLLSEPKITHTSVTELTIYPCRPEGYSEATSLKAPIRLDQWVSVEEELKHGTGAGKLRIDPAQCPCAIHLGEILIVGQSGDTLWKASDAIGFGQLAVAGSAIAVSTGSSYVLLSCGDDPQIMLPREFPADVPIRIKISMKLDTRSKAYAEGLQHFGRLLRTSLLDGHTSEQGEESNFSKILADVKGLHTAEILRLNRSLTLAEAQLKAAQAEVGTVRADQIQINAERTLMAAELSASQAERTLLTAEISRLAGDRIRFDHERDQANVACRTLREHMTLLRSDLENEREQEKLLRSDLENEREQEKLLRSDLDSERAIRTGIEHSRSWRITRPLRNLMARLRNLKN